MWLEPCDLCVCLLSFSIMFSEFIHVVAQSSTSFLFMSKKYSIMDNTIFCWHIHWMMDVLFSSHFLVIMNLLQWACMFNFCAEVCFQFLVIYLGMKFGLCGNSVFNFLRNCQVVFQCSYAFYFVPAAAEWSNLFICLSAFCFYYSHSGGYEVHSLLCSYLHLTDN